jgi:hypothetical protein
MKSHSHKSRFRLSAAVIAQREIDLAREFPDLYEDPVVRRRIVNADSANYHASRRKRMREATPPLL